MSAYQDWGRTSLPEVTAAGRREPPAWALAQGRLMETLNGAAVEFVARYARPDGTLVWRDRWPGMDGSDDPYEGFHGLALLYALGGDDGLLPLARAMWDAITWQWTEYGQVHREFDGYYDWMHHGEGYLYLYFLALADPTGLKERQRALRFAGFYTGDDPAAPNYDPLRRLMRSPINGSRGPRFEMTAEDWSTHREVLDGYPPPFEDLPGVAGPTCPWTDDAVFADILERINARMARGDVPLNLTATSLVAHAYLYTGEDRYRRWIADYLAAWRERTARNGGITPDNVGPSDVIGEYNDGKWWGGYYGWRWPHGAFTILEPLLIAGANSLLANRDGGGLDLVRSQLDMLWARGREEGGAWVVPHRRRDEGWTDYRPMDPSHPIHLWALSMDEEDLARVTRLGQQASWGEARTAASKGFIDNAGPWFEYVQGRNPAYPEQILAVTRALVEGQLERMRGAQGDPASWDVHHWQIMTPLVLEGLVQLTLGAPMHVYHGGLLHARVRYYDGQRRRAGLPPGVAALVEGLTAGAVTLSLVNLDRDEERQVVVQAGAFGEHRFHSATRLDDAGQNEGQDEDGEGATIPVEGRWLSVRLAPGAAARLRLTMSRHANDPSYDTPWTARDDYPLLPQGRARRDEDSVTARARIARGRERRG